MRRIFLAAGLVLIPAATANAQTYRPDFSCAADHSKDSIATMLCESSDAAKHELIFDQTYYALRHVVGKDGWKALKQEAIADDDVLKECLDPSAPVGTLPKADPTCYISKMDGITGKYKPRLSGTALQEASRPIDQHIALQQKLVDLGYLPAGTVADGVYGEATRQAIETWQRVSHRPTTDGFLSDSDASALSGGTAPPTTAAPNPASAPAYQVPSDPIATRDAAQHSQPDPITQICHGQPKPEQLIIGFDDPYEVKGKCYMIRIAARFGQKQWLNENAVLINDSLPNSPDVYSTIVTDPNGHLQYGSIAIVIGVDPIQYTAASGALVVAPTLSVLKYLGTPIQ